MHDPRISAIPDIHGHVKGEHRPYAEERPIPYTARMLFLWFYHACVRGAPRFLMTSDHMNLLTFEDPSAVNLVRRALKLAQAGDLYGAAETANVEVQHAAAVSEGLRKRNMRYSIGAEVDNDPRCRPDAPNIVEAMRPDGMIRAVHFLTIDHPTHGPGWQWAYDYPEFTSLYDHVGTENLWKIYTDTLFNTIETLPGQVIAHFYKPAIFGHWPDPTVLDGYENKFVAMCAERSLAIELNSRIFYRSTDETQLRQFRDAHLRLLKKAKAADVMIAVGADAHSPRDQGGGFETVLELLDAAEINELAFPIAGRLARVALKVVREPTPIAAPVAASDKKSAKETKRPKPPTKKVALAAGASAAALAAATAANGSAATPIAETNGAKRPSKRAKTVDAATDAPEKTAAIDVPSAPTPKPKKTVSAKAAPAPLKAVPPAKATPSKTAPAKAAPVKSAPANATTAKTAPSKTVAAKATAPAKSAAAKTTAKKSPVKVAPAKPAVKVSAPKAAANRTAAKPPSPGAKGKPATAKPAAKSKAPAVKAKPPAKAASSARSKPAAKKAAAKPAVKAKATSRPAPVKKAAPSKKAPAKKAPTPSRPAKNAKVSRKAPALKSRGKSGR